MEIKRKHISHAIWTFIESAVLLEEKNFSWKANKVVLTLKTRTETQC